MKVIKAVFVLFLCVQYSCTREVVIQFTDMELIRLISGDSVKYWTRTELVLDGDSKDVNDCEYSRIYTFGSQDENILDVTKDTLNCPADTLFSAGWEVSGKATSNGELDTLTFYTEEDTMNFIIEEITTRKLRLSGISPDMNWTEVLEVKEQVYR